MRRPWRCVRTSKQNKLSTPTNPSPVELQDEALDGAAGGVLIGLLLPAVHLPAVQSAREAAAK